MAAKMLVRYRTKLLKHPEEIQGASFFALKAKNLQVSAGICFPRTRPRVTRGQAWRGAWDVRFF
jgi:hypothetical protein